VLFDLDGTITRGDSLRAYLAGFALRHPASLLRLPRALPLLLRFFLGRADRGELKAGLLAAVLGASSRDAVDAWSETFVAKLIKRGLRRDALAAIDEHRRRGDALVLLSASPDLYVPRIAAALGFASLVHGARVARRAAHGRTRQCQSARFREGALS